jgi:hypothetical protein
VTDLQTLLKRGYFSNYLTPPFNTDSYSSLVTNSLTSLPSDFTNEKKIAYTIRHSIPNLGLKRRVIGIPNPVTYFSLASNILSHWNDIQQHFTRSNISRSKPVWNLNPNGRAIIHEYEFSDRDDEKQHIRGLSRYILSTDISSFYGSIYTHSIPWAIHTKAFAKQNRANRYYGNLLDMNARNGQDGQTIGVPIGPDTSIVLTEIILCAFDEMLQNKLPDLIGLRYVDDFELGFKTYGDAENALSQIRTLLDEFELEVNNTKTKIIQLPEPINVWIGELRSHRIRRRPNLQKYDLVAYFDKAIYLSKIYQTAHVLNYAISRINSTTIDASNWTLLESFVFQCIMSETGTLFKGLQFLQAAHGNGHTIDLYSLKHIMNFLITQNCASNYANEIAWALWALLYWQVNINQEAATALSQINDSVVALMTLHAYHIGLIPSGINTANWQVFVDDAKELYNAQWLLAYEANKKGWLPITIDHVSNDPNFRFLKINGVEFYDANRVQAPLEREFRGYPVPIF